MSKRTVGRSKYQRQPVANRATAAASRRVGNFQHSHAL